jgi:predicted histone-like DNA-binding protein
MAVLIKLAQYHMNGAANDGKWYAQTVATGVQHTEDIARKIEENTTFKRGEVKGMMDELVDVMTDMLQAGQTVIIDGLGRFQLVAESRSVEHPEDFSIRDNIKGVKCNFRPSGHRATQNGTLRKTFCDNAEVKFTPEYDVKK